jgi:glucose/arabinose dehydrogenase
MLSLAFPPGFGQTKQHFYVKHLDKSCNIVIARYRTTSNLNIGDINSEQIVLSLPVGEGLFGGPLYFGPDGYLYASIGDGSLSDGAPGDNAQDPTTLFGKMLRLDVETNINGPYTIPPGNPFVGPDGVRDEIWAKGFRNPWRFAFDRCTLATLGRSVTRKSISSPRTVRAGRTTGGRSRRQITASAQPPVTRRA